MMMMVVVEWSHLLLLPLVLFLFMLPTAHP
jgi:hypothetical protein